MSEGKLAMPPILNIIEEIYKKNTVQIIRNIYFNYNNPSLSSNYNYNKVRVNIDSIMNLMLEKFLD